MLDLVGLLAGAFVILAFYTAEPRRLRRCAIVSNVLFVTYGLGSGAWPIALLHAILLPLNVVRLWQIPPRRPALAPLVLGREMRIDRRCATAGLRA